MNKSHFFLIIFALASPGSFSGRINLASQESSIELSTSNSTFNNLDSSLNITDGNIVFNNSPTTALSGSAINFTNGTIVTSADKIQVRSGSVSSTSIALTGGQTLSLGGGSALLPTINVSGSNTIVGAGLLLNAITLANGSATLNMKVSGPVGSTITLNGGTLVLNADLVLDGGAIVGPGTVNLNNKTLYLSPRTNSTTLTFSTGGAVVFLGGDHFLSATWTFGSTGAFSLIGQGANLTLNAGGAITFTTTTACGMYFMNVFGLNSTGSRQINLASGQTLELYNTRLTFVGNYTQSAGSISIKDNKSVFATNGFSYTVSGATTSIVVDKKLLLYDRLNATQTSPIVTASGGTISLLNGGQIRSITRTDGTTGATGTAGNNNGGSLGPLTITAATTTLTRFQRCDKYRVITFSNGTPGTPFNFTLNGNGHKILFTNSTLPNMVLTQNSRVTFTNVRLDNLNPAGIFFAPLAYLTFGANCFVELAADMVLDASSPVWYALTSPIICAQTYQNSTLELLADGKINVSASTTLTLKNLKIKIRTPNPFTIAAGSTVVFDNCEVWYDKDFYFSSGNVNWSKNNTLIAQTSFDAPLYMNLTGTGIMTVLTDSSLELSTGSGIKYQPDISLDLNAFDKMHHFALSAYSSSLILNGATLFSTPTGLALDAGQIIVKNSSQLVSQGTGPFALTIADATVIDIASGACLTLTGSMVVN